MEVADAAGVKLPAQLGGDRGGDQLARGGKVVEPFEQVVEPCGMLAPQVWAKRRVLATFDTGRMPGTISTSMPGRRRFVAEAEEAVGREEELGDRAVGAGVDLALQIVEIELRASTKFGMDFGIGGDRNVERRDRLQPGDELGGVAIAARVRLEFRARLGRIAAQRDDMADAGSQ